MGQILQQSVAKKPGSLFRQDAWTGVSVFVAWLIGFYATLLPILASLVLAFTEYNILARPNGSDGTILSACFFRISASGALSKRRFFMWSRPFPCV